MKRLGWNKAAKLVGALVLAAVVATVVVSRAHEAEVGRADVARMTRTMKTVCIGRFLIDLPGETRFELRGPRIDGFDISSFGESEADFHVRLARREAELRATPDQFGGTKNLQSVREVRTNDGVVGKIFVHAYKVREGTRNRGLEVERYRDEGVALEAMLHGQGTSFTLAANNYNPDIIENLPRLAAKLVPNPHNRIPTEPGFCIDSAWFRDPLPVDQLEQIMMSAQLPSHPDVEFLTILAAGIKPDKQSLLERRASNGSLLSLLERWRIRELRAAPRTIGGIPGDELVTRVAERNDTTGYSFWWEVAGTEDTVLVPHFVFQMSTGEGRYEPVHTSMPEGAVIALWDKISSSIRLRPSTLAQPLTAELLNMPLGTRGGQRCPASARWSCGVGGKGIGVPGGPRQDAHLVGMGNHACLPLLPQAPAAPVAAVGISCPASAWWRCEDPPALDITHWFAQGCLPPLASLPVPPGVFGRVPGA